MKVEWPRLNFDFNPNLAPTEESPVILEGASGLTLEKMRFGIPRYGPGGKPKGPLLNTRTDSLKMGIHRGLSNRCIVPASGFYEFVEEDGASQPYYFSRNDRETILFVGLWKLAEVKGEQVKCFAILTDEPNSFIAQYHDRSPVIVDDPLPWLSNASIDSLVPILPENYKVTPMNPVMNKPTFKDLEKIEDFEKEKKSSGLFD